MPFRAFRLPSCHLCSQRHVARTACWPHLPADGDDDLVLQADMLLLAGTCIVDESVLTGEGIVDYLLVKGAEWVCGSWSVLGGWMRAC